MDKEKTMYEKDWERVDPDIQHEGHKITLPAHPQPMPTRVAISALERKAADEETELDVFETLDAYPEDALVALNMAMKQKYGWASPTPKPSFFGDIPPDLVTVKTGPNHTDSVQVPYGCFTLPGVENPIEVIRHRNSAGPVLVIRGSVRKREASVVKDLANLTREILKDSSIYKTKAIRLRADDDGNLDHRNPPEFLHTNHIVEDELILNDIELDQIKAALWAPVRNTEACVQHGIPLNRGVLLEGTYGTGKTMAATVTSKICVDNDWTYILLDDVRGLKEALLFAQRYQPAVVFAEDADRVADQRDQRGNDLLNTIDGVLTKNSKVITVLTTNHVEKLERAMLRPGRLDAVISIRPPEGKAVERLLRLYGRDLITDGEDLSEVAAVLGGQIPATIREVVERSKLAMISDGRSEVNAANLLVAAHGMKGHLDLLNDEPPKETLQTAVGRTLGELISKTAGIDQEAIDQMEEVADAINTNSGVQAEAARRTERATAMGSKMVAGKVDEVKDDTEVIRRAVS